MGDQSSGAAGMPPPGLRPSDLARIELRHAIPGRIRLRIPAIKGDPGLSREVHGQLSSLPVIRRVEVNPVTASVLVLYDPADSAAIAKLGRMIVPGLDLDALPGPGDRDELDRHAHFSSAEAVATFGRQWNRRIESATGGALDVKLLVPATLLVGGLLRLMSAKKIPSPTWYDFLWFAFGTYFTLNRGGVTGGPPEAVEKKTAAGGEARYRGSGDVARNGVHG